MNKLRKIAALLLALCMMTVPMLALADAEPTFDGVRDQSVMAADMIMIEATPALNFKNGKATPENPGDYELVYSVTDKNGVTGEDYATLTVTKKTGEEVVYKAFDFSTVEVTDNHGWEAKIGEAAQATAALKNGA